MSGMFLVWSHNCYLVWQVATMVSDAGTSLTRAGQSRGTSNEISFKCSRCISSCCVCR